MISLLLGGDAAGLPGNKSIKTRTIMGKLNAFIIQLQNQNAIFYPGQAVNGQVYVDLNAEMKMRGNYFLFTMSIITMALATITWIRT